MSVTFEDMQLWWALVADAGERAGVEMGELEVELPDDVAAVMRRRAYARGLTLEDYITVTTLTDAWNFLAQARAEDLALWAGTQ